MDADGQPYSTTSNSRVLAERGGTPLKTPRATVIVDTREQNPFDFSRFKGWFSGVERRALQLGDYCIAGLEDVCVAERKDLSVLVRSFTVERSVFVDRLRKMATPQVGGHHRGAQPNQIPTPAFGSQSEPGHPVFDRRVAGLQVPFLCTDTHALGEELLVFISLSSASLSLA